MKFRGSVLLMWLAACEATPDIKLDIHLGEDKRPFQNIASLVLRAKRGEQLLAQRTFGRDTSSVSVSGLTHGSDTLFTLQGLDSGGNVIAGGQTCPLNYESGGLRAGLMFLPASVFSPTFGAPIATRSNAVAVPLDDGTVLISGGTSEAGTLSTSERYEPSNAVFSDAPGQPLGGARSGADVALVSGLGAVVTGGRDGAGAVLSNGEFYGVSRSQYEPIQNLDTPREHHRSVTIADRVLITGGQDDHGAALKTSLFIRVETDGTTTPMAAPDLNAARYSHMMVLALGTPIVIGGYGADGKALSSVEVLQPDAANPLAMVFSTISEASTVVKPRADGTASLLPDGNILIAGGATDAAQPAPRADAEIYNPVTRTTQTLALQRARRGHTATVLPDGRVLLIGGVDGDGNPLASVEIFASGGFNNARSLATPRSGHAAVLLCDGTVLVVGGGAGAEIYSPQVR